MTQAIPTRLSYEQSCLRLQGLELLDEGEIPPMPIARPHYDDETQGVSFFRTHLREVDLSGLRLPRSFFGRSEIEKVSFKNSDLSESLIGWNDFNDVDFTRASLARSDLGGTIFRRVKFVECDLRECDLRHNGFEQCDFAGADLTGARLTRSQGFRITLSREQKRAVNWHWRSGPVPEGG